MVAVFMQLRNTIRQTTYKRTTISLEPASVLDAISPFRWRAVVEIVPDGSNVWREVFDVGNLYDLGNTATDSDGHDLPGGMAVTRSAVKRLRCTAASFSSSVTLQAAANSGCFCFQM